MTPRGTDWRLAPLVALGFGTEPLSLVSGRAGDAWVFWLHGLGLRLVTGWKLRRLRGRGAAPASTVWSSLTPEGRGER